MEAAQVTRVLIVANRTASTPHLIEEVGRRALGVKSVGIRTDDTVAGLSRRALNG